MVLGHPRYPHECAPQSHFSRLPSLAKICYGAAPVEEQEYQNQLKELYPQLSDEEIRSAQLTLEQYFALAWEIYEESVLKKPGFDSLARSPYDVTTKVDSPLPLTK